MAVIVPLEPNADKPKRLLDYIGYSANLRRRFTQHAEGGAFATSYRRPWKLIYYEAYTEQADAALKKMAISHQAR